MDKATKLYIFSGLPGVGKTGLAQYLAKTLGAVYLRVDTIEQSLKDNGIGAIYDEGYQVAFKLAEENLLMGQSVVADSTNPVWASRTAWWQAAKNANVNHLDIEVVCTDILEHKKRVGRRVSDIENLALPTWQNVVNRQYLAWDNDVLRVDTAGQSQTKSQQALLTLISEHLD